ncbi:uncharacterized protein BX663DRAFT_546169 [Cokeromyces recurvatus]|uniref:uncharacterized protein n=1 Tax=Cokeromyces recurvatus TaxID=90255 RepID=UPI00221E6B3C|nr:uncharacterized protein BX663DRAFT_546169 [Cokeromyces recurvatus]KAI7898813.1 hypothetical protein BX663DRAFT_546169 [Cokeromyces recurvatus]
MLPSRIQCSTPGLQMEVDKKMLLNRGGGWALKTTVILVAVTEYLKDIKDIDFVAKTDKNDKRSMNPFNIGSWVRYVESYKNFRSCDNDQTGKFGTSLVNSTRQRTYGLRLYIVEMRIMGVF